MKPNLTCFLFSFSFFFFFFKWEVTFSDWGWCFLYTNPCFSWYEALKALIWICISKRRGRLADWPRFHRALLVVWLRFLVPAALLFGLPDNKSLCQLIVLAFFSFGRLLNEVVKTLSTGCRWWASAKLLHCWERYLQLWIDRYRSVCFQEKNVSRKM